MHVGYILQNINYLIDNIGMHQNISSGVYTDNSIENIDIIINSLMSCTDSSQFSITGIYKSLHCVLGNVEQFKYTSWYTLYNRMLIVINADYDMIYHYNIYILRRYDNNGIIFIDIDY